MHPKPSKFCRWCGTEYVRLGKDSMARFAKRMFCSLPCAQQARRTQRHKSRRLPSLALNYDKMSHTERTNLAYQTAHLDVQAARKEESLESAVKRHIDAALRKDNSDEL